MPTYPDDLIKSILRGNRTIAMVGASGNEMRPSYFAMKYLLDKGYRVRPVNPGLAGKTILNQEVYASLKDVPAPIEIVDIFRGPEYAPAIVKQALQERERLGIKVIWMQLTVINEEAAKMAEDAGLTVIMDRCPKIEYGRFCGEIGWMGINRKLIDNRKPKLFGKGGSLMVDDKPPPLKTGG
jgi:predicted CoA-binding protein